VLFYLALRYREYDEGILMPIEIIANDVTYTAIEHGTRADGRTIPEYILNCLAKSRLAWFGEMPHHFYFGRNRTDRITFEMQGIWWFIDNQELYDLLEDETIPVRFRTS